MRLGLPMVVALNMTDMARRQGITVDAAALSLELGLPVVETVGVSAEGANSLLAAIDVPVPPAISSTWQPSELEDVLATQREVRRILAIAVREPAGSLDTSDKIDRVVLHPVWGMLVLAVALFLMFQAVFSWANVPMDAIKAGTEALGELVKTVVPEGMLQSLLVDGVIAGVGGVIVFLPQILILFLFILALEDSGYLPRAAFLLDRVMGTVGLSGRSFIPLLSSFACAIPGVMATRTISNWRDRLTTIMIAPLMTCSARLPVYALLIAAFIPEKSVLGVFNLQGFVLFALYVFGIVSAMAVAWVMKRFRDNHSHSPLLMELPAYRWPNLRNLALGLYERAWIFLQRVGTIILTLTILLWFLSTFPSPPKARPGRPSSTAWPACSAAGWSTSLRPSASTGRFRLRWCRAWRRAKWRLARWAPSTRCRPRATRWRGRLQPLIASSWSLATALSLLVWYVFAPQCISTLAAVKRETNSWRYVWIMAGYLFAPRLCCVLCDLSHRGGLGRRLISTTI